MAKYLEKDKDFKVVDSLKGATAAGAGTSVDTYTSGKAHQVIAVFFCNAGTATVKLEESADGTTWTDVTGATTDFSATGSAVHVAIETKRYVRANATTVTTGNVSAAIFLTKMDHI